jgi:hypothetical protein
VPVSNPPLTIRLVPPALVTEMSSSAQNDGSLRNSNVSQVSAIVAV